MAAKATQMRLAMLKVELYKLYGLYEPKFEPWAQSHEDVRSVKWNPRKLAYYHAILVIFYRDSPPSPPPPRPSHPKKKNVFASMKTQK